MIYLLEREFNIQVFFFVQNERIQIKTPNKNDYVSIDTSSTTKGIPKLNIQRTFLSALPFFEYSQG